MKKDPVTEMAALNWLDNGYVATPPAPGQKALMVHVPNNSPDFGPALQRAAALAAADGRVLRLLCADDPLSLLETHRAVLAPVAQMTLCHTGADPRALQAAWLSGAQDLHDSVAFVYDLSGVTPELQAEADAIFVSNCTIPPRSADPVGCTLVTSVFRSDPFLQGFINNTVQLQGYGSLIDHVFVVAKMSKLEVSLLCDLLGRQPNVSVVWNRKDPGLYNCWNLGIRVAQRLYVSNANVDDLRDPAQVVTLIAALERHPWAHVAATALNPFYDYPKDGTLPQEREGWYSDQPGYFGLHDLARLTRDADGRLGLEPHNLPHCMPVWRRDIHDRYGWFDEARYGTYADWAFWMRSLQNGGFGWLDPEPLSFYFVNPGSHNRRGTNLDQLHALIIDEFADHFLAQEEGRAPQWSKLPATVTPKLTLEGLTQNFGEHRNDFNKLIAALLPLNRDDGEGTLFIPFLERYFVWGDSPGEAGSDNPQPLTRDWIGILHVPFDAPDWFDPTIRPEMFLGSDLWLQSRPYCRGVVALTQDLAADLTAFDPNLPVLSVRHPVELDVPMFDPTAYLAAPRVIQIGDWLRKLHAIHRLDAPDHKRLMLLKSRTETLLEREAALMGYNRDGAVDMYSFVSNAEYDALLCTSVVLCLLYATAANNVVVECIARATPVLITPLPSVVEYLGPEYPLYASDEAHAGQLLRQPERILAAHEYLLKRRQDIDLSYEGFLRDIASSPLYSDLVTKVVLS